MSPLPCLPRPSKRLAAAKYFFTQNSPPAFVSIRFFRGSNTTPGIQPTPRPGGASWGIIAKLQGALQVPCTSPE